jgi:AraC-like DNA-binding protein
MANKRTLKRAIRQICEELFAESIAVSMYGPESARSNAEALLFTIVRMEENYVGRISHPEPGMNPQTYFKDLREKFSAEVSEIVDQLNGQ